MEKLNVSMLLPLISLACGILFAGYGLTSPLGCIAIMAGIIFYVLTILNSTNPIKALRMQKLQPIWIALWFFGIGVIACDLRRPYCNDALTDSEFLSVSGRIRDIGSSTSGDRAVIDVEKLYLNKDDFTEVSNLTIILYSDALSSKIDDIVCFPASFSKIENNSDSFYSNFSQLVRSKGIFYSCTVPGKEVNKIGHSASIKGLSGTLRDNIIIFIEKSGLSRNTIAFLTAILLGDRSFLGEDTRAEFADAGISHILALSGMHVGIIISIMLIILFPLNFAGLYRYRMVITAFALLIYAFITGFGFSTLRACIMAWCMIICFLLERKNSPWNALLLSAFIILLISPTALFDVGMQLSFVCVASLILFAEPLNPIDHRTHPKLYKLYTLVLCSLLTTFGSWTISSFYFHSFPSAFIICNLIILPFFPIYIAISLFHLILIFVGIRWEFTELLVEYGYTLIESTAKHLNDYSSGAIGIETGPSAVVFWLAGILSLTFAIYGKRGRMMYPIAASFIILSITSTSLTAEAERKCLVKKHGRIPALTLAYKGKEEEIRFASYGLSEVKFDGRNIMSLSAGIETIEKVKDKKCDILILTNNYNGDLKDLSGHISAENILFHPSMSGKKEIRYIAEADSLGIHYHSLRKGSYILTNCPNKKK